LLSRVAKKPTAPQTLSYTRTHLGHRLVGPIVSGISLNSASIATSTASPQIPCVAWISVGGSLSSASLALCSPWRSTGRLAPLAGGPGRPGSSSTSCGGDGNIHRAFRGGQRNWITGSQQNADLPHLRSGRPLLHGRPSSQTDSADFGAIAIR
jgi:hypothetical protein